MDLWVRLMNSRKVCRRFLGWRLVGLAMAHEGRGEEAEVLGSHRDEAADEECGVNDGDRGCCSGEERRKCGARAVIYGVVDVREAE